MTVNSIKRDKAGFIQSMNDLVSYICATVDLHKNVVNGENLLLTMSMMPLVIASENRAPQVD